MAENSEPDFFGIKLKKPKRGPKESADERYQPERNANDEQRPPPTLLSLRALEPLPFDPLKRIYEMGGEKRMVIFNHSKYEESHNYRKYKNGVPFRKYTDLDVRRLQQVFGNELGFHIKVHQDEKKDFIYDIVDELSQADHRKTSCVCVVILTHGNRDGELLASDQPYELEELVRKLQIRNLIGKPKLFIVQACRGPKVDQGFELDGFGRTGKISTHADTLVFRSSVEGYKSWKNEYGSWLIQELCRVVYFTHRDLDFGLMAATVTSFVVTDYATYTEDPKEHNTKQTPETRSTLTKLLRFTAPVPNADAEMK